MLTQALSTFFEQLGAEWVLWLLAGLSALSIAIMFERGLFLYRNGVDMDALTRTMLQALRRGGEPEAAKIVKSVPGMGGTVLRAAFDAYEDGVESVEEVIQASITRSRVRYDRFLGILGTIANNAPFIGLFGTVIGILNAFGQLAGALEGTSRSELVMASISEALVATAVGLAVAIPAVIAFNVFKGKTRVAALSAESAARLVLAHLKSIPRDVRASGDG